jgi:tol-pal system protein YbgF
MRAGKVMRLAISIAVLPWMAACVMPDDVSKLQKDVADVQQQMRGVERDREDLQKLIAEVEARPVDDGESISREELADVQFRMEQLSRQLAIVTERMSDVDQRLDRFSQELQQNRVDPTGTPMFGPLGPTGTTGPSDAGTLPPAGPVAGPPPSQAAPDPEALYNTAYADFSKGNYALAVSGFREYQQRFADSALADNALYWIAECHFSQGDFPAAVDSLDDLLGRYPDSDKAPAANLKKALAFQEQNQIEKSIIQYRYVVTTFPDTDEARLARDKLSGLGTTSN